jgi:hypothetical protein
MTRRIREAGAFELDALTACLKLLKSARQNAVWAKSPQTADAIRRAIKSADGAMRHMSHRLNRSAKP